MDAVDPFGRWTWLRRLIWLITLAVTVYWLGPIQLRSMYLSPTAPLVDFFLDWSAARNHMDGLSVYMSPEFSAQRYLGIQRPVGTSYRVVGHPPNCILYAYPFAHLNYPYAFLLWNLLSIVCLLVSLVLIVRGLRIRFSLWALLPTMAGLLACIPLMSHLIQGQWTTILLLLIVLAWRLARRDRWLAGLPLAAAVSIKLFPAVLLAHFLRRRGVVGLVVFAISFCLLTWIAAEFFGYESFSIYATHITPAATEFRFEGLNASLVGFWFRLLVKPERGPAMSNIPLADWPYLALALAILSAGTVIGLYLTMRLKSWRDTDQRQEDLLFAIGVVAMLLVSPITWDHYLLLLVLPLAILWCELTRRGYRRWWLWGILLGLLFPTSLIDWLWYAHVQVGNRPDPPEWVLGPFQSLFIYGIPTYAMLGLFAGCLRALRVPERSAATYAGRIAAR